MDKPPISSTLKIEEFIKNLKEDELIYLNHLIVERIKLIHKARSIEKMKEFNIGDRVYFNLEGKKVYGRIIRMNRKTISIKTDEGGRWNVSPALVKRIEE